MHPLADNLIFHIKFMVGYQVAKIHIYIWKLHFTVNDNNIHLKWQLVMVISRVICISIYINALLLWLLKAFDWTGTSCCKITVNKRHCFTPCCKFINAIKQCSDNSDIVSKGPSFHWNVLCTDSPMVNVCSLGQLNLAIRSATATSSPFHDAQSCEISPQASIKIFRNELKKMRNLQPKSYICLPHQIERETMDRKIFFLVP